MSQLSASKRRFLKEAGLIALFTPAIMSRPAFAEETKGIVEKLKDKVTGKGEEKEVTPPEDLMREHGVLDRVLLVYEACMRKFASKEDFDPALLTQSATIIRDFIHDYHEQSEEHYIFPRFRQANQLTELVGTLLDQHHAGRRVTEQILQLAPNIRTDADAQRRVTTQIAAFITMYRPHAAREDTDLFPQLGRLVSTHEYHAMAEDFEKEEHRKFGEDGFEKMAAHVAQLELAMGIHDLKQFTPT
jgi:hemerythrin-like domain-containing protein